MERRKGRGSSGLFVLLIAALATAVGGWYTDHVASKPPALEPVTGLKWWFTPLERNAFMRLPVIQGKINAMRVFPGMGSVWAVGESGLIVGTTDGGSTWKRGIVVAAGKSAETSSRAAAKREGWNIIESAAAAAPVASAAKEAPNAAPSKLNPQSKADISPPESLRGSASQNTPETGVPVAAAEIDHTTQDLNDVYFLTPAVGIAVGARGTLLRTQDGGNSWHVAESAAAADLEAVTSRGSNGFIAVGLGGTIVWSVDGSTWKRLPYGSTEALASVAFFGSEKGVLVDADGHVSVSVGGGWAGAGSTLRERLKSVAIPALDRQFAITQSGALLQYDDSRREWTPTSLGDKPVTGISFADYKNGVLVGADGTIYTTASGGTNWQRSVVSSRQDFAQVAMADESTLYARDRGGDILRSDDLGRTWHVIAVGGGSAAGGGARESPQATSLFNRVAFADANRGAVVGRGGLLLMTEDGGVTWSSRASGVNVDLTSVDFADDRSGLAAGAAGTVIGTGDRGAKWHPILDVAKQGSCNATVMFVDVQFADPLNVVLAGDPNCTLHSSDGGKSWHALKSTTDQKPLLTHPLFVAFKANGSGTLVGEDTQVVHTVNGGVSWALGPALASTAVGKYVFPIAQNLRERRAVTVSASGDLIELGAQSPQPKDDIRQPLAWNEVSRGAFSTPKNGIVVGRGGLVMRTFDGGSRWERVSSGAALDLADVQFLSPTRVLAIGPGRILSSDDAGKSWAETAYRRYPSPWLSVACLALVFSAGALIRRRSRSPESDEHQESVTDAAVSDRPIGWKDPDAIGLREIALGLSRFLRNRRTQPPLTIAINGQWGAGKSSLMNLLREDLRRYGFRPVWFNAWHHQSGENLLASLLANIHAQGVPPWFTLAGADFRSSLLVVRARRFWPQLALTLFALATVFFSYSVLGRGILTLWNALRSDDPSTGIGSLGAATGLILLLATVLTPVVGSIRILSAFGLRPGKLIAAVTTDGNDEIAKLAPGARYRFAREFADFADALRPRTLVIFIDDLDRCRPQNVIEVLEGVNFLITSGRCVVVLGMARPWVEACVAQAFRELAATDAADESADSVSPPKKAMGAQPSSQQEQAAELRAEQRQFARNYLQKLINIDIRVPKVTSKATWTILSAGAKGTNQDTWRHSLGAWLLRTSPTILLVASLLAVIGAGYWLSEELDNIDAALSARAAAAPQTIASPSTAAPTAQVSATSTPLLPVTQPSPVTFESSKASINEDWYVGGSLPVIFALGALFVVMLMARREIRTDDSPEFLKALDLLHPWIIFGGTSPRSLKRFLNQLRYVAMRSRDMVEPASRWERARNVIAGWFDFGVSEVAASGNIKAKQLREPVLVALAAIYRCNEAWLDRLEPWNKGRIKEILDKDCSDQLPDSEEREKTAKRLEAALDAFKKRFCPDAPEHVQFDRQSLDAFYALMAANSEYWQFVEDGSTGEAARNDGKTHEPANQSDARVAAVGG